jgi:hypothetical protein
MTLENRLFAVEYQKKYVKPRLTERITGHLMAAKYSMALWMENIDLKKRYQRVLKEKKPIWTKKRIEDIKEIGAGLAIGTAIGIGVLGVIVGGVIGFSHTVNVAEKYLKVPGIVHESLEYFCDQDIFLSKAEPISLNSDPGRRTYSTIEKVYTKNNFYEANINKNGGFRNFFKENEDNTITDRRTGLMWRKGGTNMVPYSQAEDFIKDLNRRHNKGYSDWRLPTIEELGSLLTPGWNTRENKHLESEFKHETWALWSCNDKDSKRKWRVDYRAGMIGYSNKYQRHGAGIAVRNVR